MTVPRARFPLWMAAACALLALLVIASFGIGHFAVGARDVWAALWSALSGRGAVTDAGAQAVVLEVRAPRVLAALAAGAALAASGASYQSLFKNPLVSPDILGVAAGSALGAAAAMLLSLPLGAIQLFAFGGGMVAVALVMAIASAVRGRDPLLTLILSGVVVGSLCGAGIALAKYVADPYNELPALTFWLLGSFSGVQPRDLPLTLAAIVVGIVPLALLRWRIDALSLSEDEARSLGLPVTALRVGVIACATLATAAAVAIAGTIGWIGLVIPHAARMIAGASYARVLPLSMVLGAAFMLAVDTVCRAAFEIEMPPGVITALVGTPVFVALMALSLRRDA